MPPFVVYIVSRSIIFVKHSTGDLPKHERSRKTSKKDADHRLMQERMCGILIAERKREERSLKAGASARPGIYIRS